MAKSYKCAQFTKVTIQQQNYHVRETERPKKLTIVFLLSSTTNGMDALPDNAGRRTFLTFFKKDRFLDLIINFENTASHKYLVQHSKSLWMAKSEMTGHLFVYCSIQIWHQLCFENSSCKLCGLITPQTYPWHGRCVASWNLNCVWFVDQTFPESKSEVLLELCMKLITLKLLGVLSKQFAYPLNYSRPRVLNTIMSSCRNECNKVSIGQYVKTIMTTTRDLCFVDYYHLIAQAVIPSKQL